MNKLKYVEGYSKSYLHRFIILSWIKNLNIIIKNFTPSEDVYATLNSLYNDYKIIKGDLYLFKKDRVIRENFYVAESGATLRFLIPLMLDGKSHQFFTRGRLLDRPLDEYKQLILNEGGEFEISGNVLKIKGILKKDSYTISGNKSSQFISGMLLAYNNDLKINYNTNKSIQYINITKDSISMFKNNPLLVVTPHDMSNYALFYALYKKFLIDNIKPPVIRCQNDGVFIKYINKLRKVYNLENSVDIAPILSAYLSTIDGEFTLKGLSNLKYKESDRLKEILRILNFFGTTCNTNGIDEIYIKGNSEKNIIGRRIEVSDHRICHMIIFLKYYHNSSVRINGLESLRKSDINIYNYFRRILNV